MESFRRRKQKVIYKSNVLVCRLKNRRISLQKVVTTKESFFRVRAKTLVSKKDRVYKYTDIEFSETAMGALVKMYVKLLGDELKVKE